MSNTVEEFVKPLYVETEWFAAERQSSAETLKDGTIPVVVTSLWVYKNPITITLFKDLQNGDLFECLFKSGASQDFYLYGQNEDVFCFTSHP
ncbi:hypothetical protein [Leclercia adecarboxylata]|uniref:hypothetical protein n=1 Tax=Leclercia adecarboxylata TaxID=83655 RepID=UPI00384DE516